MDSIIVALEMFRGPIAITAFVLVFGSTAFLMITARHTDNTYRYRHPLTKWMFDQSNKEADLRAEANYNKRMSRSHNFAIAALLLGAAMAATLFAIS